jgi:hypothetical protein
MNLRLDGPEGSLEWRGRMDGSEESLVGREGNLGRRGENGWFKSEN